MSSHEEDTISHHWYGNNVSEEEQADAQVGDQDRYDDRSQKSTLSQELETGYQQQQGAAWQECPTSSSYKGWSTLWNVLQPDGSINRTDNDNPGKWLTSIFN